MRKFFKSLAVLLALTLIVGVIPAAAAVDLSFTVKEKILYLGGSQGTKEDGTTKCAIGASKKVAKLIKGFDADTMSLDLESADKSIVKASNKTGKITAKSLGTTTVTVTVKDADDAVQLKQDLKVIVKKNATDATLTVENLADGDKFTVGQTVTVKLPRKGVDTDQRSLVSSDDTIATVKEQADNKRVYDVTFVKAGEVTFTAKAYQSAKYPGKTAEKVMKVTVENPAPQKVTQVADNAIEVQYASDIKDVITAASFKNDDIYYLVDKTVVPFSLISKVETDGNVAKLTFHSAFVANTTYYLAVADGEDLSFTASGHELKDVAELKLTITSAYKEKDNLLTYKYLTASGLDITTSVVNSGYTPEFTITSDYAYLSTPGTGDNAGKPHIYFTEADKTATIKAVLLIGYDETTFAPIERKDEIVITSTNAPAAIYTGETKYTITTDKNAMINKDSATKSNFAIGDDAVLQILLQKKNPDGSISWLNPVEFGITKIECGDQNIAVVGAENTYVTTGANPQTVHAGYTITGISEGTTNIILYTTNASTGKYEFFRAYPITVKAARYAASVVLSSTKTNLNIDALVGDGVTVYATVYDQYGEWFKTWKDATTPPTIKMEQASGNAKSTTIALTGPIFGVNDVWEKNWNVGGKPTNVKFVLNSGSFTGYNGGAIPVEAAKNIVFSFTESSKSVKSNYQVTVISVAEEKTNKWTSSADKTSLDTGLITPDFGDDNTASATLKLTKEYNGFLTGEQSFTIISKRPNELSAAAIYGGGATTGPAIYLVYPELDNDNSKYLASVTNGNINEAAKSITLTNIAAGKQLTKGVYKFTFYKYEKKTADGTATINTLGAHSITVTNNQKMPTVTVKSDKVPAGFNATAATDTTIAANFKFGFGSSNPALTANALTKDVDYVVSQNGDVFVKQIKVQLPSSVYTYSDNSDIAVVTVPINKLLTK